MLKFWKKKGYERDRINIFLMFHKAELISLQIALQKNHNLLTYCRIYTCSCVYTSTNIKAIFYNERERMR